MSRAGSRLLEAAREMNAIARGEAAPARIHVPPEFDVKAIRRAIGLTQDAFANEFGFSVTQIRDWEQGRTRPVRSDRAYLMLISSAPAAVRQMLNAARKTADEEPVRRAACG